MDKKYTTKNYKETQKIGQTLAKEILSVPRVKGGAVVLLLAGNLGAGKTTFLQGFARGLDIKEKVLSPTFVIMKKFKIPLCVQNTRSRVLHTYPFCAFYHIDCYRLSSDKDISELGFEKIISDPQNIVAIEWPEKIKKILPKDAISIEFEFVSQNKRKVHKKVL